MSAPRLKAPELPDDIEWLNTEFPVRLSEQKGKVVLLTFWTGSNISCVQMLTDSGYLEKKYRNGLTVVGIHSPKYPREADSDHVKKIIQKNRVTHPVVNDHDCHLLKKYSVQEWPTIVLIDAEGFIIGAIRGQSNPGQLESLVQKELSLAEQKNIRNYEPSSYQETQMETTMLSYPGRILATDTKLYISDSGHNRVLEANMDGQITRSFGSFQAGLLDGHNSDALFHNPQGLELIDDFLFVADASNHAIRRIHLHTGEVHTVMGDGTPGVAGAEVYNNPAVAQLNMPWDLTNYRGALYISMAGCHQIWKWQLSMNHLLPYRGSGEPVSADGLDHTAAFAQPMGISGGDFGLYVVDSESSSIRLIRMPDGQVSTLLGTEAGFGDLDGPNYMAQLQYPMDLQYDENRQLIWICDTFNNKIKFLRLATNEVQTLAIDGLDEPGGFYLHNDILWVANTNAHDIMRLDLQKGSMTEFSVGEELQNTG